MDEAVERAHSEFWRRFVDPVWHTVRNQADLDGTVVLPTPAECQTDTPNAMSWDISITDGALFGGFYLATAVQRGAISGHAVDRAQARRLAAGLLHLAQVGRTPGFVARGVVGDGTAHYAVGSNDQTFPWFYGLWRYLRSGFAAPAEADRVRAKLVEVVTALRRNGWRVPCDRPPFGTFGSFAGFGWDAAPRLLFLLKMAADVSGDGAWEERYHDALAERNPTGGAGRLDCCATGMPSARQTFHTWTSCPSVAGLRGLWELEQDPVLKTAYARGLAACAVVAAESLPLALEFDHDDARPFLLDWRCMNTLWRPQNSVREARELALAQLALLDSLSPRRAYEVQRVREPLFAAWAVTLCPEVTLWRPHVPALLAVLRHYRCDRLYLSQFFPIESVYYGLVLAELIAA